MAVLGALLVLDRGDLRPVGRTGGVLMGLLATLRMYGRRRPARLDAPSDLYRHRVTLLEGGMLDLGTLRGHPTLIVNTASRCGFTPQYAGLQELYHSYRERGLRVLGTPSGDFAGQELDEAQAIGDFCQRTYGVSFPLTEKQSVRAQPAPLWEDLARQPGSGRRRGTSPSTWSTPTAGWSTARGPRTTPTSNAIRAAIETALAR